MRAAMAAAEVGDDVFCEDPTVRVLEAEGAQVLGHEAALFMPSGTMANQCAIHVHCRPGDELICEERSHVFVFEGGSIARLSGTQARTLRSADGFPEPAEVRSAVRSADVHFPRSRLLVLENTHNMAGGRVLSPARFDALVATARACGMRVHVDGARLANAAAALAVPIARLARGVDSVSFCLSKGLGAPVGSLLAGSQDFVDEARRVRKALGGGMRQVGILAAAGLMALREGPAALPKDHARARALAAALAQVPGLRPLPPETNIVMVDLDHAGAADFVRALAKAGVRALALGDARVRFVTHRDLDDEAVPRCVEAASAWAHTP